MTNNDVVKLKSLINVTTSLAEFLSDLDLKVKVISSSDGHSRFVFDSIIPQVVLNRFVQIAESFGVLYYLDVYCTTKGLMLPSIYLYVCYES